MEERRRAERLPITVPIELKNGASITRDVSGLGVAFDATFPFEKGEEIEFLLRLPDTIHVRCRGRVVRADHNRESMRYSIAITIDDFDVDDADQDDSREPHIVLREIRKHHG